MPFRIPTRTRLLLIAISLLVVASGLLGLWSLLDPVTEANYNILNEFFPLEIIHRSRYLILILSCLLISSSINILRQKERAYKVVISIAMLSVFMHSFRDVDYSQAALSLLIVILLFINRKHFYVKSTRSKLKQSTQIALLSVSIAVCYSIVGFWLLDKRHFNIEFDLTRSIIESLRYLLFIGNDELVPQTAYATWFINSIYIISAYAIAIISISLFKPAIYRFRIHPFELQHAKDILDKYGNTALDFFKIWDDKSFFFSEAEDAFISYRVVNNFAITLGDPVGPSDQIKNIITSFCLFCKQNDWEPIFFQVEDKYIDLYTKDYSFDKIKIGDEAIVDLDSFKLNSGLRHIINKFDKKGFSFSYHQAPIDIKTLAQIKEVSDNWLQLKNHKERYFSLGSFDKSYVRSSDVYTANDPNGKPIAFINVVKDYSPNQASIDLMRRNSQCPSNTMDYLFLKLILELKNREYKYLNMNLAPMSGFTDNESPTLIEKSIYSLFKKLNFIFNYSGLKTYKAKYASIWRPKYLIYRKTQDLPGIALALKELLEKPL